MTSAILLVSMALSRETRADDTIKRPGDHPQYSVEIEPHGLWGWTHYSYAPVDGFGLGARLSIPLTDNGFIRSINNSVAISFGADWLHYGTGCYYPSTPGPCYGFRDSNYFFFPIVMQWNFFVAKKWSVFGEPGLFVYHGFFDYCAGVTPGVACSNPTATGVDFAFFAGARYHFDDHIALVMRVGYPTFSLGVSFM